MWGAEEEGEEEGEEEAGSKRSLLASPIQFEATALAANALGGEGEKEETAADAGESGKEKGERKPLTLCSANAIKTNTGDFILLLKIL